MNIYANMTLDDLKTGMIVTLRNGYKFTVIRDMVTPYDGSRDVLVGITDNDKGWMPFKKYNNNLTYNSYDETNKWDIVKVQIASHPFGFMKLDSKNVNYTDIWNRVNVVKLTVAEIESRLGYKIEIVSEEE